jgi:hypothetical protein
VVSGFRSVVGILPPEDLVAEIFAIVTISTPDKKGTSRPLRILEIFKIQRRPIRRIRDFSYVPAIVHTSDISAEITNFTTPKVLMKPEQSTHSRFVSRRRESYSEGYIHTDQSQGKA